MMRRRSLAARVLENAWHANQGNGARNRIKYAVERELSPKQARCDTLAKEAQEGVRVADENERERVLLPRFVQDHAIHTSNRVPPVFGTGNARQLPAFNNHDLIGGGAPGIRLIVGICIISARNN